MIALVTQGFASRARQEANRLAILHLKTTRRTQRLFLRKFVQRRLLYFNQNTKASFNPDCWILLSGGCPNPGPRHRESKVRAKCLLYEEVIGKNTKRILEYCSGCSQPTHWKCAGLTTTPKQEVGTAGVAALLLISPTPSLNKLALTKLISILPTFMQIVQILRQQPMKIMQIDTHHTRTLKLEGRQTYKDDSVSSKHQQLT